MLWQSKTYCIFLKVFYLAFFKSLRRRRGRGLEVVAVEVALEVEIREDVRISDTEERLELRIRLDRVLVLEVLLLHVRRDSLRDVGAALLGA